MVVIVKLVGLLTNEREANLLMKLKKVLGCVLSLGMLLSPLVVDADEQSDSVGYSLDQYSDATYYSSIADAMNATRCGLTVYLTKDWELSSPIDIVEGTTSSLNLNGYTIKRTDNPSSLGHSGEVLTLHPNSKLYLYGSNESSTYTIDANTSVSSGGFIAGGCTYNGGGIYMKEGAYLYMEKVAVVNNNALNYGGGVYISDDDCKIDMKDAKISYNTAGYFGTGAGLAINGENAQIDLQQHSQINNNNNTSGVGGGVYIAGENAKVKSSDGTGEICDNVASGHGGGISVYNENYKISGLKISDNKADGDGGGIYLSRYNGSLEYLTMSNNESKRGGAIYVGEKNVDLEGSTITNNHAKTTGGGVYVGAEYDLYIKATNKIFDNTSGSDNVKDDAYLSTVGFYKAYLISSGMDEDSNIGIKTSDDGSRRVIKGITNSKYLSCFFTDDSDRLHLSYVEADQEIFQEEGATGSIFGNGNIMIASIVLVCFVGAGGIVFYRKKKNDTNKI